MGDLCLSGSITGDLYVWSGTSIKLSKKLHAKPIDAIHVTPDYVFTGGKDSKVNILTDLKLSTDWNIRQPSKEIILTRSKIVKFNY